MGNEGITHASEAHAGRAGASIERRYPEPESKYNRLAPQDGQITAANAREFRLQFHWYANCPNRYRGWLNRA